MGVGGRGKEHPVPVGRGDGRAPRRGSRPLRPASAPPPAPQSKPGLPGPTHVLDQVGVELLVPGGEQAGGHVQALAVQAAGQGGGGLFPLLRLWGTRAGHARSEPGPRPPAAEGLDPRPAPACLLLSSRQDPLRPSWGQGLSPPSAVPHTLGGLPPNTTWVGSHPTQPLGSHPPTRQAQPGPAHTHLSCSICGPPSSCLPPISGISGASGTSSGRPPST